MKLLTCQRRTLAFITAALTGGALLIAASPASAAPAVSKTAAAGQQAAVNKALVTYVYDQLFNKGNAAVADTYFRADYIQHNPTLPDGTAALKGLISGLKGVYPKSSSHVYQVLAEGNLVLLHSNFILEPGTKGSAAVDIFRVDHGKIAEHWNINQSVPDTTASGSDMFSTLSPKQPCPPGETAENKKVAVRFFTTLSQDRDVSAFDRYVAGPYYQHNPQLPNGTAAPKAVFGQLFQTPYFDVSIKRVVADGDLVAIHSHYHLANDRGMAVVDIFRVLKGKVVEHWDVIQAVPETSANDNTMF
jgi:predicted SnoaL-like aldol condensation-catalyzing enzyme